MIIDIPDELISYVTLGMVPDELVQAFVQIDGGLDEYFLTIRMPGLRGWLRDFVWSELFIKDSKTILYISHPFSVEWFDSAFEHPAKVIAAVRTGHPVLTNWSVRGLDVMEFLSAYTRGKLQGGNRNEHQDN